MGGLRWVQMSQDELNEFLGTGGTGTLSFSTPVEDSPFSLPVSYGYDEGAGNFYFRLAFPPGSGKGDLLGRPVSFVTHEQTAEGWRSAVASGHLEEVTDLPYDSTAVQAMWAVDIPEVDVFDRPPEEIEFRHFRLVPDDLSGRKEVSTDE